MKSLKYILAVAGLALTAPSYAQIFKLNFDYTYTGPEAAELRQAIQTQIDKAEKDINEGLPSAQPERLMKGMANASVMSGKGVGSDYASNMDVVLLGAGVGAGADLEKDKTTDSDLSGVGVQGGVIVGTNLGWLPVKKILGLDTNRLNLYVNFFKYDMEKSFDKSSVEADLQSFGLHASYLWKKGNSSKMFGWGGLRIHTGIERNSMDLNFSSEINEAVTANSNGRTASGTVRGNPRASIKTATTSIPLEISTSVRLLYVLSVYTGLGVDYNMGSAEGKGDLQATPADITCTTGCGGSPTTVGTVRPEANIDAKGKVDSFLSRGFAGVQINLPFFVIFGQVDKAFGNDLIGATAGARFVY
jgi:hypothetical protein